MREKFDCRGAQKRANKSAIRFRYAGKCFLALIASLVDVYFAMEKHRESFVKTQKAWARNGEGARFMAFRWDQVRAHCVCDDLA
jgi:hypothetical protein